jgi:hypothetical protein
MLANIIGAFFMWVASFFTGPWGMTCAVRLVSVFSGTILVLYCFKIGVILKWKESWRWAFACLVGLMPQIAFLSSYNNNDIFSLMAVTMLLYYWIEGAQTDWSWKSSTKLAVALGITLMSYYNAYSFVLLSVVFYFASRIHRKMTKVQKKDLWIKAGYITLITFLLAGWWFIRNIVLYDGDVLGSTTRELMGEMYALDELKPSNILRLYREGVSYWQVPFYSNNPNGITWLELSLKSTIGILGNMDLYLPDWVYNTVYWFWGLGFSMFTISWIARAVKWKNYDEQKKQQLKKWLIFCLCALIASIITIMLSILYSWTDDYQPQGRYMIPAFSAVMLLIMCGWKEGLTYISEKLHVQKWLPAAACTILCLFMGYLQYTSLFEMVIPEFKDIEKMPDWYFNLYFPDYQEARAQEQAQLQESSGS